MKKNPIQEFHDARSRFWLCACRKYWAYKVYGLVGKNAKREA